MTLVLASASRARRALLEAAAVAHRVVPVAIDETEVKRAARAENVSAADTAMLLAEMKAVRVSRLQPEAVVIGADQILVRDGEWFDKPADREAARAQLRRLAGGWHELVTAVYCAAGGAFRWQHLARPRLRMRPLTEAMIETYLAAEGDILLSSVGAYRLEGPGIQLFEAIEGDYFSVLGLPLLPLLGFLRQTLGQDWLGAPASSR